MSVEALDLYGSYCIGAFCFASSSLALVASEASLKFEKAICEVLKIEVLKVSIAESPLVGVMVAGNENGILLPRNMLPEEVEVLRKEVGANVEVLSSKFTALGNLILANRKAA